MTVIKTGKLRVLVVKSDPIEWQNSFETCKAMHYLDKEQELILETLNVSTAF